MMGGLFNSNDDDKVDDKKRIFKGTTELAVLYFICQLLLVLSVIQEMITRVRAVDSVTLFNSTIAWKKATKGAKQSHRVWQGGQKEIVWENEIQGGSFYSQIPPLSR